MKRAFIFNKNRVFAPVQVGQVIGYAQVNTGASHSRIRQSFADPYPSLAPRGYSGALAIVTVSQVRLDEMVFLGETFTNMAVDVQPDSVGRLDLLPFSVLTALGCDVLFHRPLFLNFMSNEMGYLTRPGPDTQAIVKSEVDFSHGLPIFEISLGCNRLNALFDTGSALSVLNQCHFDKLREELYEVETVAVEDFTGRKMAKPSFKCRCLGIAGYSLGKCQFLVDDVSAEERKAGCKIDFVFGVNAIRKRCWVIKSQEGLIEMR